MPLALLAIGWLPFLLLRRRPLRSPWRVTLYVLNVLAAGAWYFSAVLGLAFMLM